jgi:hypothetical protein
VWRCPECNGHAVVKKKEKWELPVSAASPAASKSTARASSAGAKRASQARAKSLPERSAESAAPADTAGAHAQPMRRAAAAGARGSGGGGGANAVHWPEGGECIGLYVSRKFSGHGRYDGKIMSVDGDAVTVRIRPRTNASPHCGVRTRAAAAASMHARARLRVGHAPQDANSSGH